MNIKYIVFLLGVLILIILSLFLVKDMGSKDLRYVAIGDSYTIGEGASEEEAWPSLLTHDLNQNAIPIKLIANPSVTGWTTQDAINNELPIFLDASPTFATLLIGVNDWVQGVSEDVFRQHLIFLLNTIVTKLPHKDHLIVITIPDFSVTPTGKDFSNGRNISIGINRFNDIIKDEARKRHLSVVDIFPLTQAMKDHHELIAQDGLHPSAKEYALWEQLILQEALKILKEKN